MRWRRLAENALIGFVSVIHVVICRMIWRRGAVFPSDETLAVAPILVIRCEARIGDNLLNIPFLRALRSAYAGRQIHLLHHAAVRSIYVHCPYIDKRIEINWRMSAPRTLLARLSLCATVFREQEPRSRYALALLPRWDEDLYGPFLAWISGAQRIVGFSRRVRPEKARRNVGTDLLLTDAIYDTSIQHESRRALQMLVQHLKAIPGASAELEFWYSADDMARVTALKAGTMAAECAWVAVAPGASLDRRKWPVERFAEVASALSQLPEIGLMFLGNAAEAADCEALLLACRPSRSLNLAGRLDLSETAAALSTCRLFIGNDSGLVHLASAVGTKVLEISCHPLHAGALHPNSPARFGPTVEGSVVLQPQHPLSRSCRHGCYSDTAHCITAVQIGTVVQAAKSLLGIPEIVN